MQMLTRTHQAIRELVQASAFVELNRFFDRLEAQWRQAPPGEFPAYLAAIEGHMLLDQENQGDRALSQVLRAWIDACPRAYHPQVVMGMHCFHRACQVQVDGPRNAARLLAVAQICESATAHLLRAMDRSAHPWQRPLACCASVRSSMSLVGCSNCSRGSLHASGPVPMPM